MDDRTRNDANALMNGIRGSTGSSGEQIEDNVNKHIDKLRIEVFEFFKDRMKRIQTQEDLRSKIQTQLEAVVDRGELDFEQLKSLYAMVSRETAISSDSIISLFKPVPGASSILATQIAEEQEKKDGAERLFAMLGDENIRKIDALYRFVSALKRPPATGDQPNAQDSSPSQNEGRDDSDPIPVEIEESTQGGEGED